MTQTATRCTHLSIDPITTSCTSRARCTPANRSHLCPLLGWRVATPGSMFRKGSSRSQPDSTIVETAGRRKKSDAGNDRIHAAYRSATTQTTQSKCFSRRRAASRKQSGSSQTWSDVIAASGCQAQRPVRSLPFFLVCFLNAWMARARVDFPDFL